MKLMMKSSTDEKPNASMAVLLEELCAPTHHSPHFGMAQQTLSDIRRRGIETLVEARVGRNRFDQCFREKEIVGGILRRAGNQVIGGSRPCHANAPSLPAAGKRSYCNAPSPRLSGRIRPNKGGLPSGCFIPYDDLSPALGRRTNLRSRFVARNRCGAEFANRGRTSRASPPRHSHRGLLWRAPPPSASSSFKAKLHAILAIRPDLARPSKSVLVR